MIFLQPDEAYHIYNHAVGNENLFRNSDNYLYFLKRYEEFICPVAETYAYCLMPNHFHLLVRIRSEEEIVKNFNLPPDLEGLKDLQGPGERRIRQQFSNFFNAYSKSYNKYYKRRGALFCHNFRRKPIRDDAYFTALILYIHHNPIYHGFCEQLNDWRWSSFSSYLNNKPSPLNKKLVFDWFGGKKAFLKAHQQENSIISTIEEEREE